MMELLVALALGLLVISAVLSLYLGNARATRTATALTQLHDDGQAALALIAHHLRQAGYNPPPPGAASAHDLRTSAMTIFACDGGFVSTRADFGDLACKVPGGPAALAVAYLGDGYNTLRTASGAEATDCVGSGIHPATDDQGDYSVVQNRLFVERGNLMCAGSGGVRPFTNPQPFVENVDDLRFMLAVGAPGSPSGRSGPPVEPAGFLSAASLGPVAGSALAPDSTGSPGVEDSLRALTPAERWALVSAVKVCVLVRSATPVVEPWDPGPTYLDCGGQRRTSPDGRLRQAFELTVQLRNRSAP